ncbi:MAG: histidine phosphatase family protein [Candidatus Eremiobacteraeota bacterium]|nr:histidine phosphatase family protein [Candidatus Eremiobacteraeota bacterium]
MEHSSFSLSEGATEVLLVRHGDAVPERTAEGDHPAYRDLPLSALGRSQARALGSRLAASAVATIYSSTLKRAAETAKAISLATRRAIAYDDRLREVEIGGLDEPRHPAEFGAHLDRLAAMAIAHGGWSQIPGTESSESIRTRMRSAIDGIVAEHPGKRIVAVSHAGAINAYLADLLGMHADFFFPAANASISIVRGHGDKRLLMSLNDIAHLHRLVKERRTESGP